MHLHTRRSTAAAAVAVDVVVVVGRVEITNLNMNVKIKHMHDALILLHTPHTALAHELLSVPVNLGGRAAATAVAWARGPYVCGVCVCA